MKYCSYPLDEGRSKKTPKIDGRMEGSKYLPKNPPIGTQHSAAIRKEQTKMHTKPMNHKGRRGS